jgi:ribosomal protein S18 acetylase RimI-like enzyme
VSEAVSAKTANAHAREIAWSEAVPVSETLARAFMDDPLVGFFLPDPARRAAKAPLMFRMLLKLGIKYRACYTTDGHEAVAYWRPPNRWHLSLWDYIAIGPGMLSVFGTDALRAMGAMDAVEKQHPKTPHWYLQAVGTDPAKQGKGFGSVVIRHQLRMADAARVPCYLESSKSTNIPIYQNLGFKLTGEIKVPKGPTIWPMWRDVQA